MGHTVPAKPGARRGVSGNVAFGAQQHGTCSVENPRWLSPSWSRRHETVQASVCTCRPGWKRQALYRQGNVRYADTENCYICRTWPYTKVPHAGALDGSVPCSRRETYRTRVVHVSTHGVSFKHVACASYPCGADRCQPK